ncbi:carbohydrate-binding protein [Paenibacillus sedimenti]|uniref:Carbohydrate-binding protein n=1 Tax=Paenibacillus sedimenti TaxID=2770274 RepID=A0A926QI68_9BACL|nr:carbohydrate-binding protein [Paenibacillus sedimenti]MBD0379032.1 carbohydrate-binding protein [Paenibacillus sedimenti]
MTIFTKALTSQKAITKWSLLCAGLLLSVTLVSETASARESQFTRSGTGPLYWSTYEYQYTHNAPMDEIEWKKNIDWIANDYKSYGYDLIVSDGWIEGAQQTNENGYIMSHNDNWKHDWGYWSQYIQNKGMKMGVYYNPLWVTRSAANDPSKTIVGTNYKVKDIANSSDKFNDDLYWVDVTKPGAKEYIQGYVNYFKQLGVPYLRIDFLSWYENGTDKGKKIGVNHGSANYQTALKWMHEAAGDDMELSLVMPHLNNHAAGELPYGDMVRINEDLAHGGWENLSGQRQNWMNGWSQWANPFQGFTGFSDIAGRGSNMILDGDFIRMNTFKTDEERKSIINLFTMAGSPIAITDQHSTIGKTGSFYKNKNMLDLHNQGFVGKPYYRNGNSFSSDPNARDSEKWLGQMPDGSWIVGLFNRSDSSAIRSVDYVKDLGLGGSALTTDMWTGSNLGALTSYSPALDKHASKVVKIKPNSTNATYEAEVATWLGGTHFNNNHTGYKGFGFVDGLGNVGAKIVYAVSVPEDGDYPISYRYANATGSGSTMHVSVADDKGAFVQAARKVTFDHASSWDRWMNRTDQIHLKAGVNLITLERTAADTGAINLDHILLNPNRLGEMNASFLINGDFESGDIDGWNEWHPGNQSAKYGVDAYDVYRGGKKLYFWDTKAYKQSVHQKIYGLTNGTYTVSAWVKETVYGDKPKTVRMEIGSHGGKTVYKNITPSSGYQRIHATVQVSSGQLDVGFYVDSPGLTSLQIDEVSVVKN